MSVARLRPLLIGAGVALLAGPIGAQTMPLPRLPAAILDVRAPVEWTRGQPGEMSVRQMACRSLPGADIRRRIVDIAVQEWAFFGFRIAAPDEDESNSSQVTATDTRPGRRRSRLPPEEALRVAATIAGYWASTAAGTWIVARQNDAWKGEFGAGARWEYPWSAAFVSWVMCEAGLGAEGQFQRAVAHHTYVDQAIRSRDGLAPQAKFAAYDAGETAIEPGDLLCTARRPVYRTVAERRRQPGVGARTHCDIVVQIDAAASRLFVVGGNVRGVVALKQLPAMRGSHGLRPMDRSASPNARPVFAHLKLDANPIGARALETSPTMKATGCASSGLSRASIGVAGARVPVATC